MRSKAKSPGGNRGFFRLLGGDGCNFVTTSPVYRAILGIDRAKDFSSTSPKKGPHMDKGNFLPQGIGFLKLPRVLELFPVSRSTWWAGIKKGKYPAPVKLSARSVGWRSSDIHALLEALSAGPVNSPQGDAK